MCVTFKRSVKWDLSIFCSVFFSTCDCDLSIFSVFFLHVIVIHLYFLFFYSLSVCLRFACFEIKMVACVFVWYRDTPVNTKAE